MNPVTVSQAGVLDFLSPKKRKEKRDLERQQAADRQEQWLKDVVGKEHPQTAKAQLRILYHVLLEQDYENFGKLTNYLLKTNQSLKEKHDKGESLDDFQINPKAEELVDRFLGIFGRIGELEESKNGDPQRYKQMQQHFEPLLEAIYEAGILGYCDGLEEAESSDAESAVDFYKIRDINYTPKAEQITPEQRKIANQIEALDEKIRALKQSLATVKEKRSPGGRDLFYQSEGEEEVNTELTNSIHLDIRRLEDQKKALKTDLISAGKRRQKEYSKKLSKKEIKPEVIESAKIDPATVEPDESGLSAAAPEKSDLKAVSGLKLFSRRTHGLS